MFGDIEERYELAKNRICEIPDEITAGKNSGGFDYLDFFIDRAKYISFVLDQRKEGRNEETDNAEAVDQTDKAEINFMLYSDIIGVNYETSYSNPDYAEEKLGIYGGILSFVSAELMALPKLIYDNRLENVTILLELFLELYGLFASDDQNPPTIKEVEEAVYFYAFDYIEFMALDRMMETLDPDVTKQQSAYNIVMEADLSDVSYLYDYGEYVSDSELKLAEFLNTLSEEEIDRLAAVYTDGFRRGYDVMGVDFTPKKAVNIRYHIGQERIVRASILRFRAMGLEPILNRCATSRLVRRLVINQGYESTSPSKQFEYDHRLDDRFFLDSRFVDRRVNSTNAAYKKLSDKAEMFAGPAVIETFGEELFSPVVKESVEGYSDEQQKLSLELITRLGQISNEFMPGDSYSFTIIAFPMPDIGEDFEDIFRETVKINSLDNDKYIRIQQSIIDVLDKSDYVKVKGMNGNLTDLKVKLRNLAQPDKETQFENCTADVNIPLGEVFTSPVLKGTEGLLNVSQVYLNGYNFENLKLHFTDGVVSDFSCDNFPDDMSKGKRYIKENILFNHEFLPMGEFAIGTNTVAYKVSRDYSIQDKLPILIMEKTGPHFAVGDTCYSHAEDHAVFNPDGKEIISRENDFSILRDSEPDKAYFNCHTDVTIPYNELGRLTSVWYDGTEVDIIVDGKFVLPGTEELNDAL